MYGQSSPLAAGGLAAGAAAVGLQVGWLVSAGVTAIFVAVAVWQLVKPIRTRP